MKLCVPIPFVTKLKAVLWISFIAKCFAIILLMVYGFTYHGYISNVPPVRPIPKTLHTNMYSDHFPMQTVKRNASIVVIVLSATEKYERRNAIRETWWKDCHRHEEVGNFSKIWPRVYPSTQLYLSISHSLYLRICPSVRPSVRPSVHPCK